MLHLSFVGQWCFCWSYSIAGSFAKWSHRSHQGANEVWCGHGNRGNWKIEQFYPAFPSFRDRVKAEKIMGQKERWQKSQKQKQTKKKQTNKQKKKKLISRHFGLLAKILSVAASAQRRDGCFARQSLLRMMKTLGNFEENFERMPSEIPFVRFTAKWHKLSGPIQAGRKHTNLQAISFMLLASSVKCEHSHSQQQVPFACVCTCTSSVDWASGPRSKILFHTLIIVKLCCSCCWLVSAILFILPKG